MKRSDMLIKLARHLSNREVDDIYEDAINEMEFVQRAILEKLPNQPWFLQTESIIGLPLNATFVQLPADYNGLMTRGGVWFKEAVLDDTNLLSGTSTQQSDTESTLTVPACGPETAATADMSASLVGTLIDNGGGTIPLSSVFSGQPVADGSTPSCPTV